MSTTTEATSASRRVAPPTARPPGTDEHTLLFLTERARLLRVARRVVGDAATAEDVVQDVWLRWHGLDHATLVNPAAFLTTVTRRVALNLVQSAQHRRELTTADAVNPVAPGADPSEHADRIAGIEEGLDLLMTRLSPAELAALVLRVCFDYPYIELARILGTSQVYARQLVRRARLGVMHDQARPVRRGQQQRLVRAFRRANETGDLNELVALLAESAGRSTRRQRLAVVSAA